MDDTPSPAASTPAEPVRLTRSSHGGGCGCKIAPGVLSEILQAQRAACLMPPELLVGIETADDAAVYQLNDEQALIATTDFFMPIVDDPFDFGRIAATNAISDVYAMGGTPIMALALVGMPIDELPVETIGAHPRRAAQSVCREAGIPIAGGHTIDSVEPIYGLVVLGLVHPAQGQAQRRRAGRRPARPRQAARRRRAVGGAEEGASSTPTATRSMIATTTRLNTPGTALAALDGVHALTDVTGFGLAGHALETGARRRAAGASIDWSRGAAAAGRRASWPRDGFVTGASGRNWAGYGARGAARRRAAGRSRRTCSPTRRPRGGLLVSCAPRGRRRGAARSSAPRASPRPRSIGRMQPGAPGLVVEQ